MKERILIVDDEPHIRRILTFLLEQQGYQAVTAGDGVEALEIARAEPPDLILLDLMMPHMDGFEVCDRLRADFTTSQIPVIMVTAKGEVTDKVRGLQGGANDYLTKPYDNKELVARVQNVLAWSQSQRQANPLTGLPGNQAIEQHLQELIQGRQAFAFMYVDLDNFKALNDCYGYQQGDRVIRFTADLLRRCSTEVGTPSDFIGHIGGDDFCVMTAHDAGEALGQRIADRFGEEFEKLLDPADLERGHLEVRTRQGGLQRVPHPSVTIALVLDAGGEFEHWARVGDAAAELKAYGKSLPGNVVVKERRQSADSETVEPPLAEGPA